MHDPECHDYYLFGQEFASEYLNISVPILREMKPKMKGAWKPVGSEERTCKALLKEWILKGDS